MSKSSLCRVRGQEYLRGGAASYAPSMTGLAPTPVVLVIARVPATEPDPGIASFLGIGPAQQFRPPIVLIRLTS